jgi:osmoprotectant transport system ATP-binding protein
MIELDQVRKQYDGKPVVEDLSLSVPEGAFCVLLGPSGCGKSTTLRMINRLVPFDSGMIRIAGEDVRAVPPEALRRRIGYAIQSIGLFPHWHVEDNIATVPRLLNWPRARIRDRVTELLELLRLDPESYRHKYPHQLSGGEQQRFAIARALVNDPTVLLADEPTGNLDLEAGAAVLALLRAGADEGRAVVLVTHERAASEIADRVLRLDAGRLVAA